MEFLYFFLFEIYNLFKLMSSNINKIYKKTFIFLDFKYYGKCY